MANMTFVKLNILNVLILCLSRFIMEPEIRVGVVLNYIAVNPVSPPPPLT